VNKVKQIKYSGLLPKVSLKGASMRGPIPSMITKPVWQPITSFSEAFNDSAICRIPGANILLAKGLATIQLSVVGKRSRTCDLLDMLAMMPMFASFFHLDHDLGLDSSSFENSMSYDICQTDDSVVYLQTRHLPGAHLARRFLNLARVVKFRPTHRAFFEVA